MGIPSVSENPLGYPGIDLFVNPPVQTLTSAPQNVASPNQYFTGQLAVVPSSQEAYINLGPYNGLPNWQEIATGASNPTFSGGDLTVSNGNVKISGAGKQLQIEGGAATDFIGTATLVSGTVTVANTNIAATDRIIPFLISANASTVLGRLTYTISAGTSFTITSKDPSTPANTLTGDVSTVGYLIVRQL